jgi:hypothetical protein
MSLEMMAKFKEQPKELVNSPKSPTVPRTNYQKKVIVQFMTDNRHMF